MRTASEKLEFKKKLECRTADFAVSVFRCLDTLPPSNSSRIVAFQLGKSASSIGANYREANRAESADDFIHKIGVALKECAETSYWLEILKALHPDTDAWKDLLAECDELIRIFQTIRRKSQENRAQRDKSHSPIRSFGNSNNSPIRSFGNSVIRKARQGFTLIELMVVIAMIAVIAAAMTASVAKARTRAKIAKATQETREVTNAILAFEQYAKNRSLESKMTGGGWQECSEGAMGMILGKETSDGGEQVPVLYNGPLRDPWGKAYQYMIDKTSDLGSSIQAPQTAAALPNYYRLTDRERGAK